MKTYYSDYANHCLRHYVRNREKQDWGTEAANQNWEITDKVYQGLTLIEKEAVNHLYASGEEKLTTSINRYAAESGLSVNWLYALVTKISKAIAQQKGLI